MSTQAAGGGRAGSSALASGLNLDPSILVGIERLLFDYAHIHAHDDIVIAYTPEVAESVQLVCLLLKFYNFSYSLVPMRALSDGGFKERLRKKVGDERSRPGKTVALVFEWETMSHNQVFRDIFRRHRPDQRQIVRCINTCDELFSVGLQPMPEELSRRNADLLSLLSKSGDFEITTGAGTSLAVTLDPSRYDWISNRGMSEDGRMIALPAGEIATFPASISGTLVADYAINVNYLFEGDVRLGRHPVTVTIRDNELCSFECDDRRILRQLETFFDMQCARNVGELGFGTHPVVLAAVPENSHLNERRRGVHIGFGQHNQDVEVAGYNAQIHVDLIASGGTIVLPDGQLVDLENVPSTDQPHPRLMKSIDLFSPDVVPPDISPPDCCGLPTL